MDIEVYAFEDKNGESVTDWTTQDIREAREYAQENKCVLVARQYEYTDSEVVEDYSEDDDAICQVCERDSSDGVEVGEDGYCDVCRYAALREANQNS
jgi:hypothetical protein